MDALEADWELLRGLPWTMPSAPLVEALEDWDVLQGRESWFVALLDEAGEVIPGTITRQTSLGDVRVFMPEPQPVWGYTRWKETKAPFRSRWKTAQVPHGKHLWLSFANVVTFTTANTTTANTVSFVITATNTSTNNMVWRGSITT